jgi:hypothetical protein
MEPDQPISGAIEVVKTRSRNYFKKYIKSSRKYLPDLIKPFAFYVTFKHELVNRKIAIMVLIKTQWRTEHDFKSEPAIHRMRKRFVVTAFVVKSKFPFRL